MTPTRKPPDLPTILARLRAAEPILRRHHVSRIGVFGSVARGEARSDSDVDVLVEFDADISLFEFSALQR